MKVKHMYLAVAALLVTTLVLFFVIPREDAAQGDDLLAQGRYLEAAAQIEEQLEDDSFNWNLHWQYARIWKAQGELPRGYGTMDRLTGLPAPPDDAGELLLAYAENAFQAEQWFRAVSYWDAARELGEPVPETDFQSAIAFHCLYADSADTNWLARLDPDASFPGFVLRYRKFQALGLAEGELNIDGPWWQEQEEALSTLADAPGWLRERQNLWGMSSEFQPYALELADATEALSLLQDWREQGELPHIYSEAVLEKLVLFLDQESRDKLPWRSLGEQFPSHPLLALAPDPLKNVWSELPELTLSTEKLIIPPGDWSGSEWNGSGEWLALIELGEGRRTRLVNPDTGMHQVIPQGFAAWAPSGMSYLKKAPDAYYYEGLDADPFTIQVPLGDFHGYEYTAGGDTDELNYLLVGADSEHQVDFCSNRELLIQTDTLGSLRVDLDTKEITPVPGYEAKGWLWSGGWGFEQTNAGTYVVDLLGKGWRSLCFRT